MTRGSFFKKGISLLALILVPFETIPLLSQTQDTLKNNGKSADENSDKGATKNQSMENSKHLKEKSKMEIFIPNRKIKINKRLDGK